MHRPRLPSPHSRRAGRWRRRGAKAPAVGGDVEPRRRQDAPRGAKTRRQTRSQEGRSHSSSRRTRRRSRSRRPPRPRPPSPPPQPPPRRPLMPLELMPSPQPQGILPPPPQLVLQPPPPLMPLMPSPQLQPLPPVFAGIAVQTVQYPLPPVPPLLQPVSVPPQSSVAVAALAWAATGATVWH